MLVLRNVLDIPATNRSNTINLANDLITVVSPLQYPFYYDELNLLLRNTIDDINDLVSSVPTGIYSLSRSSEIHKFTKYRGEYYTNGQCFHIEIIYTTTGSYMAPMIVRLWRLSDMAQMEFLFTDAVSTARINLFNVATGNDILSDMLSILSKPWDLTAAGLDKVLLGLGRVVPTTSGEYYSNAVSLAMNTPDVLADGIYGANLLVGNLFLGLHTDELCMLTEQLCNEPTISRQNVLRVSGSCNVDKVTSSIAILSLDMYYALHSLAMVPYDHYEVTGTIMKDGSMHIDILSLDCMANVNTPFFTIDPINDVFWWKLSRLLYTVNVANVEKILVERTMDEELAIEITTSEDVRFVMNVDLILLSILSPAISLYR